MRRGSGSANPERECDDSARLYNQGMKSARHVLTRWGLLLAAFFSVCHAAELSNLPPELVSQLRQRGVRPEHIALVARPVRISGAGGTAVAHNATQPVQVASLVKLMTTGAALSRLGPEHAFRTELAGARQPGSDVLEGPLYVRGGGDPDFQVEDLWVLLRQLRQSGIRELRGPLVLDDSAFNHRATAFSTEPEGSFVDDGVYRAYHARPSALLIGHGALGLTLRPRGAGQRVTVDAPLAPQSLKIEHQVQGKGGECVAWKDSFEVEWPEAGLLRIKGQYPVACGEQRLPVRVPDAPGWLALWFTDIWQQLGGVGPKTWESGRVPAGTPVLQSWRGRDLGIVVRHTNKFSNNVMAQHLMLAVTPPGQTSQDAVVRWLSGLGVASAGLKVGNGSGLSRHDRVPAVVLADFLDAYSTQPAFPELLASLPRAGADGTLSRRYGDIGVTAFLKTGRLRGVSGLGGYLRDTAGRQWVWVSVLNGEGLEDRHDIHELLLKWFTSMLDR